MPRQPFDKFPNFIYQSVESLRSYLRQQGFQQLKTSTPAGFENGRPRMVPATAPNGAPLIGPDGVPQMKYAADTTSEIWVRIEPGKVRAECVRIDSEGHLPVLNPAWRDGPYVETPTYSPNYKPGEVNLERGSPSELPHYHLETIPMTQLQRYLTENVFFADAEKFTVSGQDIARLQKELSAARNYFVDTYGLHKYDFEMAKPVTGIQQGHIPLARRTPGPNFVVNSPFKRN